ncbi:MAG: T9SS type A sorting domain-containing protein [Crocinitomicaceae bacterium]|nr:T9SS type A sorting domain-containing protein [Crocinitomicaceae bacterium]
MVLVAVSTLTIDNENNYLLGGYFLGTILAPFGSTLPDLVGVNSTYNAYILKYTTPGELQWMKGIGGYGITTIYGVSAGLSGSYYVSGSFADSIDFDPGAGENFHVAIQNHDAFLMNLDGNGEYNWAQSISGGSSYASSMVTISDQGTIYLATTFNNVAKFNPMIAADITAEGDQDVLILKFNSLLELEAETKKDNTTHVYPNPTSGIIYINLQNFKADCTVELYDIAGNLLQSSFTKPALYALDLNEFSDGVYFIRLVSGDKLLTEKIVIE